MFIPFPSTTGGPEDARPSGGGRHQARGARPNQDREDQTWSRERQEDS